MSCETTPCTHCADTGRCDCGCHYRVITDAAMSEPVRNPDRLVPQEAIDAAWAVSTTWKFPREEEMLVRAEIEAAAPHIRAAAIGAAIAASGQPEHGSIGVGWLLRFAYGLEAGDN